jgi:hypothetical protein
MGAAEVLLTTLRNEDLSKPGANGAAPAAQELPPPPPPKR